MQSVSSAKFWIDFCPETKKKSYLVDEAFYSTGWFLLYDNNKENLCQCCFHLLDF